MTQHTMAMVPKSARAPIMGSVCTAEAAHEAVTDMLHVLKALRRFRSVLGSSSSIKGRRMRL